MLRAVCVSASGIAPRAFCCLAAALLAIIARAISAGAFCTALDDEALNSHDASPGRVEAGERCRVAPASRVEPATCDCDATSPSSSVSVSVSVSHSDSDSGADAAACSCAYACAYAYAHFDAGADAYADA